MYIGVCGLVFDVQESDNFRPDFGSRITGERGAARSGTATTRTQQNKINLTSEEPTTQQESSWIQAKPSFSSTRGIVPQLLSGQVAGRAQQAHGASKNGLQEHDGGPAQLLGGADEFPQLMQWMNIIAPALENAFFSESI
ncbi:unnamed protein product [Amoebophrya sp. A120]|nr:unnamed protein product [Amoebophrya sp. A120]|eukprot:GSA120T00006368001.1